MQKYQHYSHNFGQRFNGTKSSAKDIPLHWGKCLKVVWIYHLACTLPFCKKRQNNLVSQNGEQTKGGFHFS